MILPLKVPYHLQNDPGRICQKKLSKSLTTTVPRGLILSSSFARRTKEFGKTSLHRHVALSETGTLPTDCSNALHAVTPRIQLLCFNFVTSRIPSQCWQSLAPRRRLGVLLRTSEQCLPEFNQDFSSEHLKSTSPPPRIPSSEPWTGGPAPSGSKAAWNPYCTHQI